LFCGVVNYVCLCPGGWFHHPAGQMETFHTSFDSCSYHPAFLTVPLGFLSHIATRAGRKMTVIMWQIEEMDQKEKAVKTGPCSTQLESGTVSVMTTCTHVSSLSDVRDTSVEIESGNRHGENLKKIEDQKRNRLLSGRYGQCSFEVLEISSGS